ncbi:hypothetical protein BDU57DRAFT_536814 [Ampelomyces quisqualis]|uniref:Uncharacterized protein n=1 Tax=Ampelomyces quisqualis TaxID=50730 RepID=A0A6A5QVZ0_AMPQU|nr:hypothetical protein BDU57DRAFT_536814 [Ampelomyces quisqualis]
MDTPNEFGVPASSPQRPTTSVETTNTRPNATPKHGRTHLPEHATFRTGPNLLSPPQERGEAHDAHDTSPSQHHHHHQSYGTSIPTSIGRSHPPTPPAHEGRFDDWLAWLEQQAARSDGLTIPAQHSYAHLAGSPLPQRTTIKGPVLGSYTPSSGHVRGDAVGTQANTVQNRSKTGQRYSQLIPHHKHHSLVHHGFPDSAPLPPIQEWPTSALGVRPSRPSTPLSRRTRALPIATSDGPSPGHDGITPPDKKTLKKLASFERRAEITRKASIAKSIAKAMDPPAIPKRNPAAKAGTKRKNPQRSPGQVAATPAPSLRSPHANLYTPGPTYGYTPTPVTPNAQPVPHGLPSPSGYGPYGNPYAIHPPQNSRHLHQPHMYEQPHQAQAQGETQPYIPSPFPTHNLSQGLSHTIHNSDHFRYDHSMATFHNDYLHGTVPAATGMSHQQIMKPRTPSPEPIDYDLLPQPITRTYADYKYSVIHYTLSASSSYVFAQSFVSDLFALNLPSDEYKWTTHSTPGFISNGTRGSLIVLHNASDPFERGIPPTNTTSIGTYGLAHDEIHWITYAPGIQGLLEWCQSHGDIVQKGKWTWNMAKASEARFHRAYWMAATMGAMGGLLNRGDVRDDDDMFGVIEDYEEEWIATEQDLQGAADWGVGMDKADEAWREVQQEAEETDGIGAEHVITASSEWESFSSE